MDKKVRPTYTEVISEMYNLMEYNACPLAMDDKYDTEWVEKIMGDMCKDCKGVDSSCYIQLLEQLMLRSCIHINNLSCVDYDIKQFMVCRAIDNELWYWGSYDSEEEAYRVAKEIDGLVL